MLSSVMKCVSIDTHCTLVTLACYFEMVPSLVQPESESQHLLMWFCESFSSLPVRTEMSPCVLTPPYFLPVSLFTTLPSRPCFPPFLISFLFSLDLIPSTSPVSSPHYWALCPPIFTEPYFLSFSLRRISSLLSLDLISFTSPS